MNPFLELQERLRALLLSDPYFAGELILTEKIADLEFQVEQALIPIGFGLVITTAKGELQGERGPHLLLRETLTVAITHSPTLRPEKNALDALHAAILCLHAANLASGGPGSSAFWQITGHELIPDGPAGLHVQHLHLEATLRFK
jgi:hypothetical protein